MSYDSNAIAYTNKVDALTLEDYAGLIDRRDDISKLKGKKLWAKVPAEAKAKLEQHYGKLSLDNPERDNAARWVLRGLYVHKAICKARQVALKIKRVRR